MTPDEERIMRANAEAWCKRHDALSWQFPEEEARDYADAMSDVAEGKKANMERSPHEIKQEMRLLSHLESLVVAIRALVVAATLFLPAFLWVRFVPDEVKERIPEGLPLLVLTLAVLLVGLIIASVVGFHSFWQNYLDVLRRKRTQSFWEWRSATLRFPTRHVIGSMSSDKTEPPDISETDSKPPYSSN